MLTHPETLVVNQIVWVLTARNGNISAEYGLTTILPPPQESFIPYGELSEALVFEWIEEYTPIEQVEEAKAWLSQRLTDMATIPPEEQPLPWASSAPVESSNS